MAKSKGTGFTPWWKILKKNIFLYTFDHNFGLILPCPSGISWGQQTCGVMCHQISIEGIFVPLPIPKKLLEDIQNANYNYKPKLLKKRWNRLKKWLKENEQFEFQGVKAPVGMPFNQEGIQWIKIIRFESSIDTRKLLEGEIVCLIYPNCD